jgi:hypothetical protein
MATRQLEFDETIGSLKRKLDHMQVMQVQQEPKRRDRRPSPTRDRNRVGRIRLPDGICIRCGSKDHPKCTWKDACEYCKQPGHKDVVLQEVAGSGVPCQQEMTILPWHHASDGYKESSKSA